MKLIEIQETIKKGLTKGYIENLLLLSSYNRFIDQVQEYLLTVNVAQQLLEWNKHHTYRIQIEYPHLYFCKNAFVAFDWRGTDIFDVSIIHSQPGHSPTDKLQQKLDIVITQEQNNNGSTHERTLSGIELKGLNKSQHEIIKDAKRMSSAMVRTDQISPNSIDFCFCGFLKRLDKDEDMVTALFIQEKTREELNGWTKICDDLGTYYPTLEFSIEKFDVVNDSLEEVAEIHRKMDSDYSEVANNTGAVFGFILTINRKTNEA